MIFASVAMAGAVVVGLVNKEDLSRVNDELEVARVEVKDATAELGAAEDDRDDAVEREVQSKDARNQAAAAVEGVKQSLKIVERSLEDVNAEMKTVEIELKEIDLAIMKQFPDGNIRNAEELQMSLTMLKDELTESQNSKAELNAQLTAASQAKQQEVAKVKKEEEFQVQRSQQLALNGLVATVVAVNNEWGFVMINAGRAHGVSADSSLLVKRGDARVARLRVTNIEDMMTVANVVDGSAVSGVSVRPGDKVIFGTTN